MRPVEGDEQADALTRCQLGAVLTGWGRLPVVPVSAPGGARTTVFEGSRERRRCRSLDDVAGVKF